MLTMLQPQQNEQMHTRILPNIVSLVSTVSKFKLTHSPRHPRVVLQGPVRRTGKGPRTGPDCNRFKQTNSAGPLNFFEKDRKRPRS